MSDLALALIADYGVPILFCVTFLSCLALPVPSALQDCSSKRTMIPITRPVMDQI